MTFAAFLQALGVRCPDGQRRGQFIFNALNDVRPDLVDAIRGTELDPFHDDDRIRATIAHISEKWDTT